MIDNRDELSPHHAGPASHNELLLIQVLVEDLDTKLIGQVFKLLEDRRLDHCTALSRITPSVSHPTEQAHKCQDGEWGPKKR